MTLLEVARNAKRLDRDEELALVRRAQAGDQRARAELVETNMRHVIAIARKYRRYGVPFEELLSEGSVGLLIAIDKFDADRGTRLVTYAGHWIRARILDYVVRSATMIGGGMGAFKTKIFFTLRRERAKLLEAGVDRQERLRVLAEKLNVTERRVEELLRQLDATVTSINAPLGEPDYTLEDRIATDGPSPEERVARTEQRGLLSEEIEAALAGLDPRERHIASRRMLDDDAPSLAELGRDFGISRERARQLEARAKEKIRRHLELHAPSTVEAA